MPGDRIESAAGNDAVDQRRDRCSSAGLANQKARNARDDTGLTRIEEAVDDARGILAELHAACFHNQSAPKLQIGNGGEYRGADHAAAAATGQTGRSQSEGSAWIVHIPDPRIDRGTLKTVRQRFRFRRRRHPGLFAQIEQDRCTVALKKLGDINAGLCFTANRYIVGQALNHRHFETAQRECAIGFAERMRDAAHGQQREDAIHQPVGAANRCRQFAGILRPRTALVGLKLRNVQDRLRQIVADVLDVESCQHRLQSLPAGGAANRTQLRKILTVQQNLIANRRDGRLTDNAFASPANEFDRRLGCDIAREQKGPLIVRNDHASVARRRGDAGSWKHCDGAGGRLVEPAYDAKRLPSDDRCGVVDRAFAIMIVDCEFQTWPPFQISVAGLGRKVRKHKTCSPSFASVTGSARKVALRAMRSSGESRTVAASAAPPIDCRRG